MHTYPCRGISPPHPGRAKPVVLRPTRMPGARLPATAHTGLTRPEERRAPVQPDCPSSSRNITVLPIQRIEEPCPQPLRQHDPRNSLKSKVLRGSLEPAMSSCGALPSGVAKVNSYSFSNSLSICAISTRKNPVEIDVTSAGSTNGSWRAD